MSARSQVLGHPAVWDKDAEQWIFEDTKEPCFGASAQLRSCALCSLTPVELCVLDPDGSTDNPTTVIKPIDACIVDVVAALNNAGLHTRTSCCGHGVEDGLIVLRDGRQLQLPVKWNVK